MGAPGGAVAAIAASNALDRPALSVRVPPHRSARLLPPQQQDQQETQPHWSASNTSPVTVRKARPTTGRHICCTLHRQGRSWAERAVGPGALRLTTCTVVVTRSYMVVSVAAQTYSACHLRHDSARSMHMRSPSFQVLHDAGRQA